ncbi:MAG: ABC transporter ATP-binding protein [Bacteroidales bacterium]|nr:ABC transporter ATP-binding protein [Bacteroidales bacterium]
MEKHIIDIRNVSKSFGEHKVLKNINLYVKKGEFVTILGPSGCGKSTLLRCIAGFEQATEGDILIDGKDISDVPPHDRPVNTVFQRYALFPHLNVYDNVAFALKIAKVGKDEIRKRVSKVLKIVGMTDYEDRDVLSLSGGQQQRVAIARAIINRPQVLLLDEPLAALDLKMRKDMQMEIKEMHKTLGMTFVYVTHDQEEALTLSDTVVVMNEGEIQQIGTPTDIYNEPANAFVADFIGESNILDGIMLEDKRVHFLGKDFDCVDEGFEKSEKVDVVLRPEDIYILYAPNLAGQFEGTVTSCIFKGVHYEMWIVTDDKCELMIQDYNAFEVGSRVALIIKASDLHVMKKERLTNTFDAVMVDSNHVEFLDTKWECLPQEGISGGEEVKVHIPFDKVDLMDTVEDGAIEGEVRFILFKGDHYHLRVRTTSGNKDSIYADTKYVYDDRDLVGIKILPQDIEIER